VAAREAVMNLIKKHGLTEDEEIDVFVALQEALANAVLHGCQNDGTKTIFCRVEVDPSALTIVVADPGPGFDIDAINCNPPDINTTDHGRGICLMRSLMDEVGYRRGGSEVRLQKRRKSVR
jgi:anti-sigma regulatory factor (Ser/Thr protein kinase)